MSRRGEQMIQLRVPTGKRNHIIDVQKGHRKLLLACVFAAFRVHRSLLDNRAQGVQARVKRSFPRVVGVYSLIFQTFSYHFLHFGERAVRLNGGRNNVPPIAQREKLPPYDETRGRFSLPSISQHRGAHRQRIKLNMLRLPITVGTLQGFYFKSHLTFPKITSSEEEERPSYRRFPPLGTLLPRGLVGWISPYNRTRKDRNGPLRRVYTDTECVLPLKKPLREYPSRDSLEEPDPFILNALSKTRAA